VGVDGEARGRLASSTSSFCSRKNCWHNAIAESFFCSLKKGGIKKRIYADRESAVLDVTEYIEDFYNPIRRHSYLGGVSPIEFKRCIEVAGRVH